MFNDMIEFKGHFQAEMFSEYGLIDKYSDNNLVVTMGRNTLPQMIGGLHTNTALSKIVLGGEGTKIGFPLIPKDEDDGFDVTRTELFSETSDTYRYSVEFTPSGVVGVPSTVTSEYDSVGGVQVADSTASIDYDPLNANVVTFVFDIPRENANGPLGEVAFAYSEAGLYSGANLIAMKVFPQKIKENTVLLRIKWSIIF